MCAIEHVHLNAMARVCSQVDGLGPTVKGGGGGLHGGLSGGAGSLA